MPEPQVIIAAALAAAYLVGACATAREALRSPVFQRQPRADRNCAALCVGALWPYVALDYCIRVVEDFRASR